ncbi:serine hydrolase [Arthrobacter sp. B10-11]|uniref:serine hydrolase domain-containing protein n=1 Tax=Arthrobacter sp. B10-11 TaxID=3081160 RepID=UPI0029547A6D|nr:serine hydrolase [Arthrobacter sp. B10-11]MDV8149664.1 serine hydrolase [Arthrobacter sp. B10-11]
MAVAQEAGSWIRAARVAFVVVASMVLGGCTFGPVPGPTEPALPTSTSPPTASGPPSGPARDVRAQLEQYSQGLIDAGAPAVLVELHIGAEVWTHAAGVRNPAGEAARAADAVHVGHITQSLVAVSVLKLAGEGRLSLDEPASTYLPELQSLLHQPEPFTVRRLLGHTTGMPDYYAALLHSLPPRQALATRMSPENMLAVAATLPWHKRSAQGLSYSNSNYLALGLIVERLRGLPLADVLRADVVQPLGLGSTRLTDGGPVPEGMVHGYALIDSEPVDTTHAALHRGSGATGLVSTVGDLNTFFDALVNGRLLGRDLVGEMLAPVYAEYGLGLYQWNDACTNGFYNGYVGDVPGYGTVAMASADGSRRLALAVAYPPSPLSNDTNAIALEMTGLAEEVLNGSCRLGGGVSFGE